MLNLCHRVGGGRKEKWGGGGRRTPHGPAPPLSSKHATARAQHLKNLPNLLLKKTYLDFLPFAQRRGLQQRKGVAGQED